MKCRSKYSKESMVKCGYGFSGFEGVGPENRGGKMECVHMYLLVLEPGCVGKSSERMYCQSVAHEYAFEMPYPLLGLRACV